MLQQAHEQCAERVKVDSQLLIEAAQRAASIGYLKFISPADELEVAQLQAKGWPNAFMAGRLVEVRLHSQCACVCWSHRIPLGILLRVN